MENRVILSCNIIDRIVDNAYEFKLFVKKGCPYCSKLNDFLKDNKDSLFKQNDSKKYLAKYEVIYEDNNVETFFNNMAVASNNKLILDLDETHKTFPVLFRNNVFIGGCDKSIKVLGNEIK